KGGFQIPENLQWAILATILGGLVGSYFGSQKFNLPTLRYMLALGLVIACAKLMFT
ncbi:MAG: sulfite exporter TauE/SafE family protein, partial [Arcicella sp.]|nr:sulfite exporter TauE/SafE family protein [Arcicella sp.]